MKHLRVIGAALAMLAVAGESSAMELKLNAGGCGNQVQIEASRLKTGENPEPKMSRLASEVCPGPRTQIMKTMRVDAPGSWRLSWSFQCVAPVNQAFTNGVAAKSC